MLVKEAFDGLRVLHFKNFAYELNSSDIDSLLKRLGAVNTQVYLSCKPETNHRALAEFRSTEDCWRLIKSLHQRELCGHRLIIVFGRYSHCAFGSTKPDDIKKSLNEPSLPEWVKGVTSLSAKWLPGSSLFQAFYSYPKATPSILTNIVRCLVSVTAFYVQTLHLMNRLNLPAPFCDTSEFPGNLFVLTEEELSHHTAQPCTSPTEDVPEEMDVSSGPESEFSGGDSSDNCAASAAPTKRITAPRKPLTKLKAGLLKRLERRLDARGKALRQAPYPLLSEAVEYEKSKQPSSPGCLVEPLFEECVMVAAPRIKMRLIHPLEEVIESDASETISGFGVFSATKSVNTETSLKRLQTAEEAPFPTHRLLSPTEKGKEGEESSACEEEDEYLSKPRPLSLDELDIGRASQADLGRNPIFSRSTDVGPPSSRLYVKNLHKRTTEDDLWRVFGSFRRGGLGKAAPSQFSIQLLTGGRMRGQAFVAFDSIDLATEAMNASHGYLLNGKPMHVQFARGSIAKADPNSLVEK